MLKKIILATFASVLLLGGVFLLSGNDEAAASVPSKEEWDNYLIANKVSDKDRNIINPILRSDSDDKQQNCGKYSKSSTTLIMGECDPWYTVGGTNTFYLHKKLGISILPDLELSAADTKRTDGWKKVAELYGRVSGTDISAKSGYNYITCQIAKLDGQTANGCSAYGSSGSDNTTNLDGLLPTPEPNECTPYFTASGDSFAVPENCVFQEDDIRWLIGDQLLLGASIGQGEVIVPKTARLTDQKVRESLQNPTYNFAWETVIFLYDNIAAAASGSDKSLAQQSSQAIRNARNSADLWDENLYCSDDDLAADAPLVKTVSGPSGTGGVVSGDRFVICQAASKIPSDILSKMKVTLMGVPTYYIVPLDTIVLPKNHLPFEFRPADQERELAGWKAVTDTYRIIANYSDSLKTSPGYADSLAAEASDLNIQSSLAEGYRLAYTVSPDGKYFIVSKSYVEETVLAEQKSFLTTKNLINFSYSADKSAILREVTPMARTVPSITNDLQMEAVRSAKNIYEAISNSATMDNTNYNFAEPARLNLGSAIDDYLGQKASSFFISPVLSALSAEDIARIQAESGTKDFLVDTTLIIPRVITAGRVDEITSYDQVNAWQAISRAYGRISAKRPDSPDMDDALASVGVIDDQINKFTGAPGIIDVTLEKNTVDRMQPVKISVKFNNATLVPVKYNIWVSNKNVNDIKDPPTGSGEVSPASKQYQSFEWAWNTDANTPGGKHAIVVKAYNAETKEYLNAKGTAEVTVQQFGQSDVTWRITPSPAKINAVVSIGYTIKNRAGNTFQLFVFDCGGKEHLKDSGSIDSNDFTRYTEWYTDGTKTEAAGGTGVCGHTIVMKMIPPAPADFAKSQTCLEVYDSSPTNACATAPGGAEAEDPPTEYKELKGSDFKSALSESITDIWGLLKNLVSHKLPLLIGMFAFFGIVYSGILYLTAAGDEKKAETGRKALIYTVIGIVLTVAAWVIVRVVINEIRNRGLGG